MALSNIFKEPRREIVESVVGIVFTILLIAGLWEVVHPVALWIQSSTPDMPFGVAVGVAVISTGAAFGLFMLALAVTHDIGDGICNFFQRRGVFLRPKVRPYAANLNKGDIRGPYPH